jgi:hypothetical protein
MIQTKIAVTLTHLPPGQGACMASGEKKNQNANLNKDCCA